MNDRVELKGIEVYAKHGVLESEQTTAQVFRVDVTAFVDTTPAALSDDLADALDYGELALQVREAAGAGPYKLIETVASKVADVVMSHEQVVKSIVTIHKPDAPIDLVFEDVSVTVERTR